MTKYLDPSFTVAPGLSDNYRDNYDKIFRKKQRKEKVSEEDLDTITEEESSETD